MTKKVKYKEPKQFSTDEIVTILYNLDYYTRQWKEHYGFENRKLMSHWQERAKIFIDEHLIID